MFAMGMGGGGRGLTRFAKVGSEALLVERLGDHVGEGRGLHVPLLPQLVHVVLELKPLVQRQGIRGQACQSEVEPREAKERGWERRASARGDGFRSTTDRSHAEERRVEWQHAPFVYLVDLLEVGRERLVLNTEAKVATNGDAFLAAHRDDRSAVVLGNL